MNILRCYVKDQVVFSVEFEKEFEFEFLQLVVSL